MSMGNIFKPALIVVVIMAAAFLFLSLPCFFINDIEIEGNSRLTEDYIKTAMDIRDGETVIFWNAYAARSRLLENNYVDRVDISIDYMSRRVSVKIRERVLSGYVEYVDGIYLYIDDHGRVLDSATWLAERLPVVTGLEFSGFTVGEILNVDNPASFELVVTLAQLFNKYQMGSEVIKADVSKVDDIHLYIGGVDVEFGGIEDADEKIRQVMEIMENHLADDTQGFLNVKDINKPAKFRPLK